MPDLARVPLSVVGGYLGAGKTTLINQLLSINNGKQLAVLVNDFGSINIDAALLHSASEDTIELTNGCVCCTLSGDLFFTIGDLLDRKPPPEHIIVEASGIADPAKIAAVSLAEKDLRYAGIVTIVDGMNITNYLKDPLIAPQIYKQLHVADLLVVSKTDRHDTGIEKLLESGKFNRCVGSEDLPAIAAMLFDATDLVVPDSDAVAHPDYVQWSDPYPKPATRKEIERRLDTKPRGLLRFKAVIPDPAGGYWEVHVVGAQHEVLARDEVSKPGVTAIGLRSGLKKEDLQDWWELKAGDARSS